MHRAEPIRRQPENTQANLAAETDYEAAPPRQTQRPQPAPAKRSSFGLVKWFVTGLLVAVVAVLGWLAWSSQRALEATIDSDKYQAVHLSNGQVYFGNLTTVNAEYMQLSDVYYLERQITAGQTAEQTQEQTDADSSFQLRKYINYGYGSEDKMTISRQDIIRYENLRPDGAVARVIAQQ